ncbi:ABC transporter permease [Paenibacillus sp. BR2-3]|uniref:ABC transporter permease n=1 Tax=Paenibacillus sp. BR2-3 TaxID=3048494 RepID=UPI00397744E2
MSKRASFAFPTSARLFGRRLISHWREQSAIIRTAADWTVLLYVIIPGGLFGGRLYYGFWNEALPSWSTFLPFMVIPLLLVILLSTGGMLLLLQEGDLLFLRQRQSWIKTIMLRGIVYSLAVTTLKITAAFVLLLPFLIRGYGLTAEAALALLFLTIACSWCIKLLGHIVRVQRQSWRRWLWQIPAIALPCGIYFRVVLFWSTYPVLLWITGVLFAGAALFAIQYRLRMRGTFMNDVREDYKQRMKIAGLLLRGVLDKPRPTRYKPWIFRKSEPLLSSKLPESRLSAAAIKALVRNPAHLKLYLQFTGVAAVAIFIVPPLLKWLVFVVLTSLMAYWLFSFWSLFIGDDYIGILPFTKEQKAEAGSRAVPILLIPFAVICSAVVCFSIYAWWGLILFIPLGAAAGFMISRVFGTFRLER